MLICRSVFDSCPSLCFSSSSMKGVAASTMNLELLVFLNNESTTDFIDMTRGAWGIVPIDASTD